MPCNVPALGIRTRSANCWNLRVLQTLFQRCEEWQLLVRVGNGDASKAFDKLEHPRLDEALHRRKVPLRLRAATLRELLGVSLRIRRRDSETDGLPLGKGGRQGASETPTEWNFLLDFALADTVRRWQDLCYGVDLGDGLPFLTHCCWADDLFWQSASFDELACVSQELTIALSDCQLSWKPGGLSFVANRVAAQDLPETWCSAFPVLTSSGAPLWFERVEAMPCLGVLPTPTGDTLLATGHRFTAGLHHQYARQRQLACKGAPKRLRLGRFYSAVASSILWEPGGWTLTAALVSRFESLGLSLLRRMVAPHRERGEGFVY